MTDEYDTGDDKDRWQSTSWAEIEAAVDEGGYRAGFVRVFLQFRGAVLDDMPLDGKGRPEVVNQSNFAKHFGISVSTFHRWLGEHGGEEFAVKGERKEKADAAKERQRTKTSQKDRDSVAQEVRRMVASSAEDFKNKVDVRRSDSNLFWIDAQTLLEWDAPPHEKGKVVDAWLRQLDEEAAALERYREKLLEARTELDLDGLEGAA